MNLIRFALRKPISILVLVAGLFFFGIGAVKTIKVDILPKMNLPVIYLAHPFGGYTPNQMESYFAKNYVNILLFANGVKSIETKNTQGLTLMKVTYYEDTNMAQAAAELSALSNRIQAGFPPGSQPPFIIRFDASSLPVGQLVLSSKTKSNNELQDLANVYVRASFTSIPGLLSPPPFGGSPRTIEVNVDPDLLRSHNLTPDQIVEAIKINNQTAPSGNVRIGDQNYITPTNNTIKEVKDFEKIPLFKGGVQNLYLGDVATVKDGADITAGYALVNGKRSVYVSIAKAGDASTWEVVQNLKKQLPKIQSTLPEDVSLSYEFDQSVYVINSVKSLITEGAIGAILTGLMVLLFLGDKRAAFIVILTIPISIISGVLFLKLFGQTINLMSLSGLALAIGILVDESTVTIENIHQHLDMGKPKALAIWDACQEIALPKLLILLCILAVFAPAFTMTGIPGALFLPLAMAIGFSMIISFLLSQTFVPIMANWLMKDHAHPNHGPEITDDEAEFVASGMIEGSNADFSEQKKALVQRDDFNNDGKISRFEKFRNRFMKLIDRMFPFRKTVALAYLLGITAIAILLLNVIGQDVFPKTNSEQFQLRLRAADGTRLERTEEKALVTLKELEKMVGKEHISITSVYVGQHPSLFSVSPIYLFMAGPHEAVFQVALKEYHADMDVFKDDFRKRIKKVLPDVKLSFEPIELTDKVLSQGSPTPIEIRIAGKNKKANEQYAAKIIDKLNKINYFRDVQLGQPIKYPSLDINIDRVRAAQLGVDMNDISRSLIASTSSSRYTEKNTWIDEKAGLSYNVQVQVPLNKMKSESDMGEIPLLKNATRPVLSDVATITPSFTYGENDNLGAMPYISVTANIDHTDLGTAVKDVNNTITSLGELPRGMFIEPIGLSKVLVETMDSLQSGLLVAVIVIFLMLSANFQSFKVSLVILTTVPAVVLGALLMLLLTGSTLNLQSYMGIIMSVGVSIANAVLLVTNAEQLRKHNGNALESAREAASLRLRPIIMTSIAMIAGMLPMAIGHGDGGEQVAPLGRAVIGGLLFSTFTVLIILPMIFAWAQGKSSTQSVSLDPEDKESKHYISSLHTQHEK
ncbi:RND transporter [Flavobacterium noncentrifugens]|uniref:Multidrug efflux pump subunit AcrB n=1 Tax=Flavobacterium noncentrifugens TaxID=1128970 RepID=A0A1G8TBP5_9FLAO|nr:efflux RND transporter permease subunit [Flavobacterium noncentrifugens]GEP50159.1 RND transporter [Flavobacterium noncentrifugens]SDJ38814.1 Multidrug efflux pump subunit AcrB [Flavobacterium noncentrifugens]